MSFFSCDRRKMTKVDTRKVNCLKIKKIMNMKNARTLKALSLFTRKIISELKNNNSSNQQENEDLVYNSPLTTRAGRIINRP